MRFCAGPLVRYSRAVAAVCSLAVFSSGLAAFQAASPADAHRPSPMPDRVIVNWTQDAATGFSVTWRTSTPVAAAFAEIAEAEDGRDFAPKARRLNATTQAYETNLGAAHSHSVTFAQLAPSTAYLYRVGDGKNWSEWHHFRTASDKPEPLTFLYFGDAQSGIYSMWSRVIRKAYSMAPDARFIVHAGDLINRSTLDQEWGEWHQAGGWVNQMVPSIPSVGNHEYGRVTPESERTLTVNWRQQYTLPLNGPAGLEETCYYTDIQGVRMIALNSNEKQEEQAAWLDKLLANNPNRWTVIAFHHPFYSTAQRRDNKELRDVWQPVFDKHRVDLVLQGHDHAYGRSNLVTGNDTRTGKSGTVYVVSVGGAKLYPLASKEVFERAADFTQLFQIIRVSGDKLAYEARTAGGELYDAFELQKRRGKSNKLVNRVPKTPARVKASGAKAAE